MQGNLLTAEEIRGLVKAMIKLYPQDRSELNYNNDFELLCAVVLSAQTTDVAVNKVTPALFDAFPDPVSMADADPEEIAKLIQTIGLYKNKSRFLQKLSRQLLDDFGGRVPQTREELVSLAGVGRKTANVVLANAFDIPAFAVDTHVERVCKKFRFVNPEASVLEVEKQMTAYLPEKSWRQSHHSILLFGRYQCTARRHDHGLCLKRLSQVISGQMPKQLSPED